MKLYLDIIFTFIKIQLLSFGGGHASIPIVQYEIVDIKNWMSVKEFSDLLAMDEITPGPLAINCATFVGKHLAGIPGSLAATLGCIIPSCILALLFARLYKKYFQNYLFANTLKGLRCMVIALLASTTLSLFIGTFITPSVFEIQNFGLFILSFFVLIKYKPNPLYVILGSGLINLIFNVVKIYL